jgi:hypothetical protein
MVALAAAAGAQVITVDSHGQVTDGHTSSVDRRFAQIEPTHVPLPELPLNPKTRQEVIRIMQSEQGFAMRPFPKGHKGLTLVANGKLEPAGEAYLSMITSQGTSAKPGDRVVLTDVKIEANKIIFDLNGGPDRKHRFLDHVSVGAGPGMTNPVVQDNNPDPTGSRLTLVFKSHVPELTGADVKALLAPLISFDVKTPVQAFTDTLPPKLKEAILNHKVMVGMSIDMVLFAKGRPDSKTREMDGNMPFEEWIYGVPPKPVEFVRINGNRVIRLEVAKVGEVPEIFNEDVVSGLMRTDGTPAVPTNERTVAMGDVTKNPDTQAPVAPPSILNPGEKPAPGVDPTGVMRPVRFPTAKPDEQSSAQPAAPPTIKPADAPQDSPEDAHPAPVPTASEPPTEPPSRE